MAHRNALTLSASGFTLIELLVGIGIIGLISSIVIIAINPGKQLSDAKDADRILSVKELQNAIVQYTIDEWDSSALTGQSTVPAEGAQNAVPICKRDAGELDDTCFSLDFLVPEYLVDIPVDPDVDHETHAGYCVYLSSSRYRIFSINLAPEGSACAGDEDMAMQGSSSSEVMEEEAEGFSSASFSAMSAAPIALSSSSVASSAVSSSLVSSSLSSSLASSEEFFIPPHSQASTGVTSSSASAPPGPGGGTQGPLGF